MKYKIKNAGATTKTYENESGQRIKFGPREEKVLKSLPPDGERSGWKVEEIDEENDSEDSKGDN